MRIPLRAGLLILGGLAPFSSAVGEATETIEITVDGDTISLVAKTASLDSVITELGSRLDFTVQRHAPLDERISLEIEKTPLPGLLDIILAGHSFLLVESAAVSAAGGGSTLWIFSDGAEDIAAATDLVGAALGSGDLRAIRAAIRDLRRLGTPAALHALSLALSDDNARVRAAAFAALARTDSEDAVTAIASTLLDADPYVRREAVNALAAQSSATAARHLEACLADPDPSVRAATVDALADREDRATVGLLAAALDDPDPAVRLRTVDALEDLGGPDAIAALSRALTAETDAFQAAARESLELLRRQQAAATP